MRERERGNEARREWINKKRERERHLCYIIEAKRTHTLLHFRLDTKKKIRGVLYHTFLSLPRARKRRDASSLAREIATIPRGSPLLDLTRRARRVRYVIH